MQSSAAVCKRFMGEGERKVKDLFDLAAKVMGEILVTLGVRFNFFLETAINYLH